MDSLIENVKQIDDELYKVVYMEKDHEKGKQIWNSIKGKNDILELATKVVKNKFGDRDTFLATAIVECMLIDYPKPIEDPNQLSLYADYGAYNRIYQSLIDKIYSNVELARIVLDGYSNGGYSFLLYTLFNDELDLNAEQKAFAIEEAMHKIGTTKYCKQRNEYLQELEKSGITDDLTVMAPEIGPVGAKTWGLYVTGLFASLNTNQAHGRGEFDICYYILKNHNFADKMEQLVYDFYADHEYYKEIIEYWKNDIVNLCRGEYDSEPLIYYDEVLYISDNEVFARLPFEQATRVIKEINFIKRLCEIRPTDWELDSSPVSKVLTSHIN